MSKKFGFRFPRVRILMYNFEGQEEALCPLGKEFHSKHNVKF